MYKVYSYADWTQAHEPHLFLGSVGKTKNSYIVLLMSVRARDLFN